MWFVLLGTTLLIVVVGGLYFRRRLLAALELFGVTRRVRKFVGYAVLWLLYALPVLTFAVVFISIAVGRESFTTTPTGVLEWLLVYPFWFAVLVMLQTVPLLLAIDVACVAARRRIGRDRAARYRAFGCLAAIAIFAVYTPARILVERDTLNVNHYDVGPVSGKAPLRIAFFADLQQDHHTDETQARRVVSLVNGEEPDVVLVGGDWINTGSDYIDDAAKSGGLLKSRLGTFSVRGDHEHFAYRDQHRSVDEITSALAKHGVDLVHNQVRWIEHDGKRIAVVYLSYNYIYRTPAAEIRSLIERAADADYSILITHQFDKPLGKLVGNKVDLALIAHTHGGQVNPVVGFVHANIARIETPYVSGRYRLGTTTLIVTSGIGFSIAPFRYASPASIEIIDVHL